MTQEIDRKTLDKIRKLLNLAKDGGASEGEASGALEKAREIMAAHNLTMAHLEASGKSGGEGSTRLKNQMKGKALYKYQQSLMATVCDTNFCAVGVQSKWNAGSRRHIDTGYSIIGREANVIAAVNMFEYLNASLERIVTPHLNSNSERLSRWALSFKEGAAGRLAERLRQRHRKALAEQSAMARAEREARYQWDTSNALVVVMEDYAQAERDANQEHRMGWAPGEAAVRRAQSAARAAEFDRREEERRAALTEDERRAEDAKRAEEQDKWQRRYDREQDRYWANKDEGAYWAGRDAAEDIGLDGQVGKSTRTALK